MQQVAFRYRISTTTLLIINTDYTSNKLLSYVLTQTTSNTKSSYLVAYLGDEGDMATAVIGGNTVDIWGPPPSDSQAVFNPKSSITLNSDVQAHVLR